MVIIVMLNVYVWAYFSCYSVESCALSLLFIVDVYVVLESIYLKYHQTDIWVSIDIFGNHIIGALSSDDDAPTWLNHLLSLSHPLKPTPCLAHCTEVRENNRHFVVS